MFGVKKYNTSLYSIFHLVYIHNLMEYCCTLFIVLILCNYRKSDALGHLILNAHLWTLKKRKNCRTKLDFGWIFPAISSFLPPPPPLINVRVESCWGKN